MKQEVYIAFIPLCRHAKIEIFSSFFQERMNRSLVVCQDRFEAAKLQKMKTDASQEFESCVNRSVEDSIRVLPHVVEQIKSTIHMN
jgi:hypothetical protein